MIQFRVYKLNSDGIQIDLGYPNTLEEVIELMNSITDIKPNEVVTFDSINESNDKNKK